MHRPPLARARYANRGHYVASGGAYLFFCGCVAFTVALLTLSGFVLPQHSLPAIGQERAVAKTVGPILVQALKSQDLFLSGFILLFAAVLTLVGTLVSDLLLGLIDPRVRLGRRAER